MLDGICDPQPRNEQLSIGIGTGTPFGPDLQVHFLKRTTRVFSLRDAPSLLPLTGVLMQRQLAPVPPSGELSPAGILVTVRDAEPPATSSCRGVCCGLATIFATVRF